MVNQGPSAFLFIGKDDYLKEEAIKKIERSILNASSRELDYKVFDAKTSESRDILEHISTLPFMASKRLAVVKNFEELSPEDIARIIGYLKVSANSACLIMDTEDDSVLKDYPELSKYSVVSRFGELTDSQFHTRASQMLAATGRGKKIGRDAAMALKELYGSDLGSVSQELDKLSSFVGANTEISQDDIEKVSGRNLISSAFELTDAIELNDIKKALSIVSDLLLSGKKHYEIIGLLCWQMKRLFRARLLLDKGMPEARIANAVKIGMRYQARFFKHLRSSSLAQIESKLVVLLESDLDIKRTKYDPALVLEFAVIKLCLGLR